MDWMIKIKNWYESDMKEEHLKKIIWKRNANFLKGELQFGKRRNIILKLYSKRYCIRIGDKIQPQKNTGKSSINCAVKIILENIYTNRMIIKRSKYHNIVEKLSDLI